MDNAHEERWFVFSKVSRGPNAGDISIPFECQGDMMIIHQDKTAYVRLSGSLDLVAAEACGAIALSATAVAAIPALAQAQAFDEADDRALQSAPSSLGDYVSRVLEWLGFQQCPACERRRTWLNRASGAVGNALRLG